MKRWAQTLGIALPLATLLLGGCASTHMAEVPVSERVVAPSAGKALVVFVRPSSFGGAIQSVLYDGDTYIGTLSAKKQIAYQAEPGSHLFMVVSEAADFMNAELVADKTYYAVVVARPGVWRARFSFRPQNGQIPEDDMRDWVASTSQVVIDEKGRQWAEENAASVAAKKAKYLPAWERKADKQVLEADAGR
jgi:hypothetical protein